jgi:hypothetical protein
VIYVVEDPALQADPEAYIKELRQRIEDSSISNIKQVSQQTHSLTVEFTDNQTDFCMDVVPVIETNDLNEYCQGPQISDTFLY